jgi:DNA-binding transcriptional LysR family regulator
VELRHLRYFQAVAEELSFSRAAQKVRVAQPAVSRTVKELETQLGVELLRRTKRSVVLTPAGAALLKETALLLQRLDEAARRVQRIAAGEEGELRLGYIGPPTQAFLGRMVKEFRRLHPRVTVVLEERTPERVWEMVARGRLAIGLTRPVMGHGVQGMHTLLLRREKLYAALPSGHPLAIQPAIRWRDLAREPLIVLSRREGVSLHDAMLAACRSAHFAPNIAHTPSLISTVLSYVEAGAGVGVISDSICALGQGTPLDFRPLAPARTVDLVMVWSERDESPPAAAFRGLVEDWLRSGLLWKEAQGQAHAQPRPRKVTARKDRDSRTTPDPRPGADRRTSVD